jgi:Smr domain
LKKNFKEGDRIFLLQTGEAVVVKKIAKDGWVYVLLDGDEIPVPAEELSDEVPDMPKEEFPVKKLSPPSSENLKPEASIQHKTSTQSISIAFEAVMKGSDISAFIIYLINDMKESCTFEYDFYLDDENDFSLRKIVLPHEAMLLHEIEYDALNQKPAFELVGRDIFNKYFQFDQYQKIKPQNFFNKKEVVPALSKEAYAYHIPLKEIIRISRPKQAGKIVVDTEQLLQQMKQTSAKMNEVEKPEWEIDLHMEALVQDHAAMPGDEKLNYQLTRFQQSLERAISHHQSKLYVIHGIGSGILKQKIHKMLRHYPHVKSFNNDYHPRYGFGATEIFLE